LKALNAEGVPCSGGYAELNKMPYLNNAFQSKNFQKMYPKEMLDFETYKEQNLCPENETLCNDEAIWLPQNVLLGTKKDMDDIALAIERIHENADKIKHIEK
jgi:hypothetical protein